MCTAVVGGSIHRADSSVRVARDQISTTPMTIHRTKDRRKPLRREILLGMYGVAVTIRIIAGAGHLRTLIEVPNADQSQARFHARQSVCTTYPQTILRPRRARWRPR